MHGKITQTPQSIKEIHDHDVCTGWQRALSVQRVASNKILLQIKLPFNKEISLQLQNLENVAESVFEEYSRGAFTRRGFRRRIHKKHSPGIFTTENLAEDIAEFYVTFFNVV